VRRPHEVVRHRQAVTVQKSNLKKQTLKPDFRFLVSRDETRCFTEFNLQSPTRPSHNHEDDDDDDDAEDGVSMQVSSSMSTTFSSSSMSTTFSSPDDEVGCGGGGAGGVGGVAQAMTAEASSHSWR
jgi:hypothetical protein